MKLVQKALTLDNIEWFGKKSVGYEVFSSFIGEEHWMMDNLLVTKEVWDVVGAFIDPVGSPILGAIYR